MKRHALFFAAIAPLLLGADGVDRDISDLPACGESSYLIYRSGKVVCQPALPDCTGQLLHAGAGGGLSSLSCTPKFQDTLSDADRQRVRELQTRVATLSDQLKQLGMPPVVAANYIGNTVATTTGRITFSGAAAGLPSANAMCAAEFSAGAHMCSVREMVGAVLNSTLLQNQDVPKAWLYMPTWNNPDPTAQEPLAGLGDSCGGYTDGTTTRGWTGMAVDWSMTYIARNLHFNSGSLAPCDQPLPIACCK